MKKRILSVILLCSLVLASCGGAVDSGNKESSALPEGGSSSETQETGETRAQKARGADFSNGSLAKRAKALIPILIPLFISAFRRADELATAMECRCYRGGEGRTRMTILKFTAKDFLAFVIFGVFVAGVVLLNMIPCAISL